MLHERHARLVAGGVAARCRAFALGALVVLCSSAHQAHGAATHWRPDTPLGVHAMLYLDAPSSFKRAMFAQSARLGAGSIRVDLALTAISAADDSEHWQQVDEVMALARRYQLRPVGILLATPALIAACPERAYTCPPADLAAWKRMVFEVVAHTRGVIDTFEILNEPDGNWAFTGAPADYARMLRAAHEAITTANPQAKVAIAATMGLASRTWLAQALAHAGPHPEALYDIANVHIRARLDQLSAIVRAWRAFFTAHRAADKPLWVTEFGYPSDPGYQDDPAYRSGPPSQAAYLRDAIPTLIDAGVAKVFVTLRDNLTGPFASEGVITGTVADPPQPNPVIVPKPAFTTLRHLAAAAACPGSSVISLILPRSPGLP